MFEIFAQALCEGRAIASGRDCDLKISASDDGRVIKVATIGDIDDIAEHAAALGFRIDRVIYFRRRGCSDDEENVVEIGIGERAGFPCNRFLFVPSFLLEASLAGR